MWWFSVSPEVLQEEEESWDSAWLQSREEGMCPGEDSLTLHSTGLQSARVQGDCSECSRHYSLFTQDWEEEIIHGRVERKGKKGDGVEYGSSKCKIQHRNSSSLRPSQF